MRIDYDAMKAYYAYTGKKGRLFCRSYQLYKDDGGYFIIDTGVNGNRKPEKKYLQEIIDKK